MVVTKDKNLVTFDCEDGKKPYVLDINTATMFGRHGRALIHVPKEICNYLSTQYIRIDSYKNSWLISIFGSKSYLGDADALLGNSALLRLADKMDSLGYAYNGNDVKDEQWEHLIKNEKDFIKAIVENPDITPGDFIKANETKQLMLKFGIKKETFSSSELDFIQTFCPYTSLFSKYFDYFCYYTKQGIAEIYSHNSSIINVMRTYFVMCEDLSILPEKTIFTKTFSMVSRLWKEQKEQIAKERLLAYSEKMRDKLFFENDTFTIVIPSCPMDFHKEAKAQENCVERLYKDEVIRGNTNVVFVRKKENPDKSYITCEVDNNGKIRQFLLSHNRSPYEKADLDFRYAYRDFLKTSMRQ